MSFKKLLTDTCHLEQLSITQDAETGAPQSVWTRALSDVPCRIALSSAQTSHTKTQEYCGVRGAAYMEGNEVLLAGVWRLVSNERTFAVEGVSDMGSKGRYMTLYLSGEGVC